MLTDSSLTNILVVSGVSQIRYRVYSQRTNRENLAHFLKNTPNYDKSNDILLRAYNQLISANIPALWRISSEPSTETAVAEREFTLELWVFWFDERHTGKIDANDDLYALDEIKVGSFTWENAYSKIQSPTSSPIASTAQSNSSTPVTVSDEYKYFIKSIRNLVHVQMKSKGAIPLGDFYIYPESGQDVYGQDKSSSTSTNIMNNNTSLLCCSYNIYLASTNLIFQPNTRRMRIRPITSQTVRSRGKRVIISPSGETAYIATNTYTLPKQTEENILRQWSLLLDIPYTNLIQHQHHQEQQHQKQRSKENESQQQMQKDLPNLVAIKSSAVDETYYYPSCLIFISSSSKLSPTALSGMNGLFGFNQGYSEDLGDKWHRGAWKENISNYWEYTCPRDVTTNTVLDTLSQDHGGSNSMINLLQKAINEPVIASPLMATKSVATPGSAYQRNDTSSSTMTPNSSVMDEDDGTPQQYQQPQQQLHHRNRAKYQSGLSLVDFAMAHFAIPPSEELPEYPEILSAPAAVQNNTTVEATQNASGKANHVNGNNMSGTISTHPTDTHNNAIAGNSTYRSPQMSNLELDAFGIVENMDVDSMVMEMPNRWIDDGMGDLDSFDFGVTEEDFDFFESVPTPAVPVVVPAPQPLPTTAPQQALPTAMDTKTELNHDFANDMLLDDLIKQEPMANDFAGAFDQKEILSLDEKQQQHILDTDMDIASLDNSVTPLQVGMATTFNNSLVQQQQQQQLQEHEHQQEQKRQEVFLWNRQNHGGDQQHLFVPPQFAPVHMDFAVNDAKYNDGGKFTYTPALKSRRKGSDYQPDYVPIVRKKKSERRKSSKMILDSIEKDNKSLTLVENEQNTPHISTIGSSQRSSESEDSSSSEESASDQSEDENLRLHRTVRAVSRAQDKYLKKVTLLKPWRTVEDKSIDQIAMDYDSPFARTIASSKIRIGSRKEVNENEEFKALDYLCQQAVMGGYPFSGGIESKSSNGFEANEGESTKVIVARRRNLLQKFNGDTIHIPSTPNDVDVMTQSFKQVLSDIFYQRRNSNIDDMCIDQLPLPASVTVKGPLNVQQYYDLSETNQAHSKYGKYQVKKRRPAEPNLDILQPPNIMISRQDDLIEGSSKLLMFWEKLRLEPYSAKKHINYFVVYPKNDSIEGSVSHFFKGLSTIYETCQLGVHHPGSIGPYRKGLVPVPLLPQLEDESFEDRQMRSYIAECQNLGSAIGGAMAENLHFVIYIVNPASHLGSNLDLSRCFNMLMGAYHAAAIGYNTRTTEKTRARVVMQLMPIEHILRPTSFGGCLKFGMKEIAFSVYNKCHVVVNRHHQLVGVEDSKPITEMYAPAFILTKPVQTSIPFQLKKALSSFPTILESHAVLHMGYCFSFDRRWMIIVWTDNRGELVEFTVLDNKRHQLPLTTVFEEAWTKTREIAKRTGFAWTFVIAKIGLIFEEELQAWIKCITNEEKVTIVSLDIESSLFVDSSFDTHGMHETTNAAEPLNTPMMNASATAAAHATQAANNKKVFNETEAGGSGQTKTLLLNHRVAYSNKRERMSNGIVGMDPVSEDEEWMIPLASGYMIHTPPSTENPNNELFNSSPLVIEIHLLYNQTNHSAYSTLRDIIKKYHALSYVNVMPSNSNCFPNHLALVERLSRILLVVNT